MLEPGPFHVFLVARIGTPQKGVFAYRCVGALQHSHCYGILAIRALYRFFSLLELKENGALVRDELRLVDAFHRRDGSENGAADPYLSAHPGFPCPYTLSLLAISWTTDLVLFQDDYYISGGSLEQGLMDARDGCWAAGRSLLRLKTV